MKYILLFCAVVSCAMAEGKRTSMNVSTTIVYNCQVIDSKNEKFCRNVDIQKTETHIIIKY